MALSMAQMGQDPAFERFLAATVGTDSHGTNVTVLSMLARLEVDPWIEASELAAMSDGSARKRLDALLTRFNDVPIPASDRAKIISGLLLCLPKNRMSARSSLQNGSTRASMLSVNAAIYWIIAAALVFGLIVKVVLDQ